MATPPKMPGDLPGLSGTGGPRRTIAGEPRSAAPEVAEKTESAEGDEEAVAFEQALRDRLGEQERQQEQEPGAPAAGWPLPVIDAPGGKGLPAAAEEAVEAGGALPGREAQAPLLRAMVVVDGNARATGVPAGVEGEAGRVQAAVLPDTPETAVSAFIEGRAVERVQAAPATAAAEPTLPVRALLSMPMTRPVGAGGWDAALGERLVWMVKGERQQVELRLTPPQLGPLEVRLTINDDKASVSFVSHHALVRDAVESALPRLREMLAQSSVELVHAEVADRREQERGGESPGQRRGGAPGRAEDEDAAAAPGGAGAAGAVRVGRGLLDLFA